MVSSLDFLFCLPYTPGLGAREACNLELSTGIDKRTQVKPALSGRKTRTGEAQQRPGGELQPLCYILDQ